MEEQNASNIDPAKWQHIHSVLVVDDDENWCFISKRLLKKVGVGKEILTANNGLQALKKLQHLATNGGRLPELVFLDLKMPVMDGFDFLDEVTKTADLDISSTRIYICSSSHHPKDKERASQYPVAGFISKPLTQEILLDILNQTVS